MRQLNASHYHLNPISKSHCKGFLNPANLTATTQLIGKVSYSGTKEAMRINIKAGITIETKAIKIIDLPQPRDFKESKRAEAKKYTC
jgi:hypothetical protein